MQTIELAITGMTCGHCVAAVTRALQAVPGVASVEVDLAEGRARVGGAVAPARLVAAVAAEGYQAAPAS